MKKNYKLLLIILTVFLLTVVALLIIYNVRNQSNINDYTKYSLNINVVLSNSEKDDEYNIDTIYDGEKMYIKPEHLDNYYFYKSGQILKLDEEEYAIYTYNTDYSYLNLYSLCNRISNGKYVKKTNNVKEYKVVLDENTTNEFIKNIYLKRTISGDAQVVISVKDGRIISVEMNAVTTGKEELRVTLHYTSELYHAVTEYEEFINRYEEKITYDSNEHAASKRQRRTPEYKEQQTNDLILE